MPHTQTVIYTTGEIHCCSDSGYGGNFAGWWLTAYDEIKPNIPWIYFSNKSRRTYSSFGRMSLNYTQKYQRYWKTQLSLQII